MKNSLLESINSGLNRRINESVTLLGDLEDYKPWSGAEETWYKIIDADKKEALDNYLEEMYPEGISIGDLNDLLWFDGDQVLRDLGLADYPKDVEVEVTNIKFAEDVDPDDVDESTTVEITIESEDDDVKDLVRDALYDDFYRLSPGEIIDFEYKINESCKSENGKKSLKEAQEVSDEAYEVADKIVEYIDGAKSITWDEFNDYFDKAVIEVYGNKVDPYGDFEGDVRSILGYRGYGTIYEGENDGGLELVESTKLDDIDAEADDKKEIAKKDFEKEVDDADADKDDKKKELNESVDKSGLVNFIKEAIEEFKNGYDGTYYFKLGNAKDETAIYYVIGWQSTGSYDEEDVKNMIVDDSGDYAIHGKVAINIDDLQSDYDWDWYMPSHKNGEVEDTDEAIYISDDANDLADGAIEAFNRFKDYSFGKDAVIEE